MNTYPINNGNSFYKKDSDWIYIYLDSLNISNIMMDCNSHLYAASFSYGIYKFDSKEQEWDKINNNLVNLYYNLKL